MTFAGEKRYNFMGFICDYFGELDENGLACGEGFCHMVSDTSYNFNGTWFNDRAEGVCK